MEAKELRIGNYIKWISTSEIDQVKDIESKRLKHELVNNVFISDVEPIKLTEDWLWKFGFVEIKPRRGIRSAFKKQGVRINVSNSGNFYFNRLAIYSIHQLQNLYFAITGEELSEKIDGQPF